MCQFQSNNNFNIGSICNSEIEKQFNGKSITSLAHNFINTKINETKVVIKYKRMDLKCCKI